MGTEPGELRPPSASRKVGCNVTITQGLTRSAPAMGVQSDDPQSFQMGLASPEETPSQKGAAVVFYIANEAAKVDAKTHKLRDVHRDAKLRSALRDTDITLDCLQCSAYCALPEAPPLALLACRKDVGRCNCFKPGHYDTYCRAAVRQAGVNLCIDEYIEWMAMERNPISI
ncbi:hypothetical protein JMJ77_0013651 [Colletotrichum scovillei]|uniref:Uncharacterized protein n=1 Tax=Colletotrichum scovillei TaxID=1209932 RepID=A0A9P7QQ05_9PEZI|nr:hypothetical protein JMJ78_0012940 [Colletotrichum scovillei]KAG7040654.1 hypothetical protein JMJ77_0013651 [Colletotrichum scovillei]KAG7060701.1 hypothetical protein JMJ76_0006244 [Colletotrichum scovillei]